MGAEAVLRVCNEEGEPTFMKFIFRLCAKGNHQTTPLVIPSRLDEERISYRNEPSVLTLRSCRMNHTPKLFSGSVNLKALTQRLPIRFRVNIPLGCGLGSQDCVLRADGDSKGPCPIGPVGVIGVGVPVIQYGGCWVSIGGGMYACEICCIV